MRVERFEAVVIGGGQAGLAVAQQLAERDVDFVVLSDEKRVGDNWRRRWDGLRLFTPARYSGLPGWPFPAPPNHLPDKDEVADYLERYAERFDLPVCLESPVTRLSWNGSHYVVEMAGSDVVVEARMAIVATGPFQRPFIPCISRQLSPEIYQIHSSEYRNPFLLPDGPTLVVGAGNSGAQIALELSRVRKVWLAGRPTGHLPRRALGRDLFDWLWPVMNKATTETWLGRRMAAGIQRGGDPLIGIPERALTQAGVVRVGRVEAVSGGLPRSGDAVLEARSVVWCTGFTAAYDWIALPVFEPDGRPHHRRGVASGSPGLFFAGLRFQYRQNSALIGGTGADASFIAGEVARMSLEG